MKITFHILGILVIVLMATGLASATTVNTFLHYSNNPSENILTVTQGESVDVSAIAYSHGELFRSQKLEVIFGKTLFQDYESGTWIDTDEYFYSRNFSINTNDLHLGTNTLRFTATSRDSESDSSELTLIILEKPDEINPEVIIHSPSNGVTYENKPTEARFTAIDDNLDYCEYSFNGGAYAETPCENLVQQVFSLNNVLFGENTLTIRAYDEAGNMGEAISVFNVDGSDDEDTISPIVNITSPENGKTYNYFINNFSFIVEEENLQVCWYKLNHFSIQSVGCEDGVEKIVNDIITLEGVNTLTVYARDISGNVGSDSITFTLDFGFTDDQAPIVDIFSPTDHQTYDFMLESFEFTVEDDFLYQCWYELNGNTNLVENCNLTTINSVSMNPIIGINNLTVYAEDLSGNIGFDKITFKINESVDPIELTLSVITPKDGEKYKEKIKFETRTNKNAVVLYSLDDKNNVTMSSSNSLRHFSNELKLSEGWHTVTFCAISGDEVVCETVDFKIYKKTSNNNNCDEDIVYGDTELPESFVNRPIFLGEDETVYIKISFGEKIFWGIVTLIVMMICIVILSYAIEVEKRRIKKIN